MKFSFKSDAAWTLAVNAGPLLLALLFMIVVVLFGSHT
jgi:hypothetical protein